MIVHHFITNYLLFGSWILDLHRYVLIIVLMVVSDFTASLMKLTYESNLTKNLNPVLKEVLI